MKLINKMTAVSVAVLSTVSVCSLVCSADEYPSLKLRVETSADGNQYSETQVLEPDGNLTLTITANGDGFKQTGSNGYKSMSINLDYDKCADVCKNPGDINTLALHIESITFDGREVKTSDEDKCRLVLNDLIDGSSWKNGWNIDSAIDENTAWKDENGTLYTVSEVKVVLKVTGLKLKNVSDSIPVVESGTDSDEIAANISNPGTGEDNSSTGGDSTYLAMFGALTMLGSAIVVAHKRRN